MDTASTSGTTSKPGIDVTVDADLCIGSGDCVRVAPEAFRIDDDRGISEVLAGAATTDPVVLIEAARGCPTQAIRLVRGGAILYGPDRRP